MTAPAAEPEARTAFGLKKGGKSRLQERLDKQASKRNATVRNALLASVTSMAVVGGAYSTWRLAGGEPFAVPGLDGASQALGLGPAAGDKAEDPALLAAVALTPGVAVSADQSEAQRVFDEAIQQLDAGQPGGVATLTRAANLGLAPAQLKLAGLYESGENGVGRDPAQARLWARRAAESGDPQGMHAFGMYLFDGVGGAKNRPEALNWLLKAAEKGLVDSQFNVAKIYENGDEGIAANRTEALKWYMIAARTGDTEAPTEVRRLSPQVQAHGRRAARAAAEAFQIQPLA
jgi:localization factor PodJL